MSNCLKMDDDCEKKIAKYESIWDTSLETSKVQVEKKLIVKFHPGYSTGTVGIRGDTAMSSGRHHYWEIKMITPVYGTDVMVGFGTKNVNLSEGTFCSPLGSNNESWGYSYRGYIQHNGQYESYLEHFKQGCLVGVYLDTWRGKLQFFMNRAPVGSAYTVLNELELYPMACSSSAKIIMKITYSSSLPVSLQTDCIPMLTPFQRIYLPLCFSGQHFLDVFADILKKLYDKAHNVHIYVESEIELSDESSSD